jgi:Raf kinase inhibitor-like YbhB/YbcL family protein
MKPAISNLTMASGLVTMSLALMGAAQAAGFKLTSADVPANSTIKSEHVFNDFGCTGNNMSPALSWSGAPATAKSFAVTVYDPDAPTGSGFWHWLIVNIPASETSLAKNAGDPKSGLAPKGSVQARNDYGTASYGGPCPPKGDKPHRYIFTVFAVDTDTLDKIDENTSGAVVGFNLHFHTVAKASFTARYGIPK